MNEEIYTELILEHNKNPSNFGRLEDADSHSRDLNPSCGDVIEIFLKFNDKKLSDVKFDGKGCAVSQASASMLTEAIKEKTVEELIDFNKDDMLNLLGISLTPLRRKCALLGFKVMKVALISFLSKQNSDIRTLNDEIKVLDQ